MISVTIDHASLRQCLANLDSLPRKKIKPAARKGVRAAARPIWAMAKNLAPRATGELRRSLKVVNVREKAGVIQSTVSAAANKRGKGGRFANRYAHIVEGGARAHMILPKKGKFLRFSSSFRKGKRGKVQSNWTIAKKVNHPGTRARRFLARAATSTQAASVAAFIAKMKEVAG